MTALQARVVGVVSDENPAVQQSQAPAGAAVKVAGASRRNRRRPGVYKPMGLQFPLFHAWRP